MPALADLVTACTEKRSNFSAQSVQAVERRVQPTEAQRSAFLEFQRASAAAAEVIRISCPARASPDPTVWLNEAAKGLESIMRTADLALPSVSLFYAQLDDEQKAQVNVNHSAYDEPASSLDDADTLVRTCTRPPVLPGPAEGQWRGIRLTEVQEEALAQFQLSVEGAASRLKSACPAGNVLTPPRRLNAMRQRAEAILQFVNAIRQDADRFYASLDEQQRTAFKVITYGD